MDHYNNQFNNLTTNRIIIKFNKLFIIRIKIKFKFICKIKESRKNYSMIEIYKNILNKKYFDKWEIMYY